MQIQTRKKSSKKLVIVTLAILTLVVAAGTITYLLSSKNQKNDQTEYTKKTDKKDQKSVAPKEDISTDTDNSTPTTPPTTHEKEKDITPAYEGEDANTSQTLTGAINYTAVANNNLVIRTTINQMLDSGTCQLTLTNGTKTVTKTSEIAQNPSSSTCKGFDVPTSELGSGNWNIRIEVNSPNRNGTLTGNTSV